MNIYDFLEEYNLETDDIRWSLCLIMAQQIKEMTESKDLNILTHSLWSGEIGDKLYNMEERWIQTQGENLLRGKRDEGHLRDDLAIFAADKLRRLRSQ